VALTASQVKEARRLVTELCYRRNPQRGRAAAVAEANAMFAAPAGGGSRPAAAPGARQVAVTAKAVPKAGKKAAKKTKKAAKKAPDGAGESLKQRVDRVIAEQLAKPGVREALVAAQAPQAAPGTGRAPAVRDKVAASFDAAVTGLGGRRDAPFYRLPGSPAGSKAVKVAEPPAQLDQMSSDQLRDYAAGVFKADAQARGFGSPSWGG